MYSSKCTFKLRLKIGIDLVSDSLQIFIPSLVLHAEVVFVVFFC